MPQSKFVENTARFLQNKIDTEKCGRDWAWSQNLVSSLTLTKFYKSQCQYFPTDNIPPLESDASVLDLYIKGKCTIPMRNIEIWERRAHKLTTINSHADLFSSAAYLCMQQQTMSVPAPSRLQAVAKSIKHATAMSTMLAMEIFQARRDAVLATSKILLDNSNHELRNAPINSTTLFGNKIREVAKSNFEAPQQRFLATSSVASSMQQLQKVADPTPPVFKSPKQPTKFSRPLQTQSYRPKNQTQSYSSNKKEYAKRSGNQKQFPSSKPASSSTKYWCPALSTASLTTPRHSSGRKVGPFCGTMGRIDRQQMCPFYRPKRVQDPYQSIPPLSVVPIKLSQSSSPLLREEIAELLKKRAVEWVRNLGTLGFYSRLFLIPKMNGKLRPVMDLWLLNQYINKHHFKMETVNSVRQSIRTNDWAVSIDLTDAYLHVPIHPISRKYLRFVFDHQEFQFTGLPFGMS